MNQLLLRGDKKQTRRYSPVRENSLAAPPVYVFENEKAFEIANVASRGETRKAGQL
jgi:hypothetical protein